MDERKFDIIIHATDENFSRRLIQSLEAVDVPEGFAAEIQPVTGAEKFFAYETARQTCDAKYKIYIDERAVITDKNFLIDLLKIFRDEKIGVVGTGGAIELSTHGVSLTSAKRTDKNFRGEVQIADGFFFATQYDLPWRIDLFADNFFGGQAQCVEFRRAGYKVVVGGDWIAYENKNLTLDENARQKFLDEYSADLFPLVTITIPTFNRPKFFRDALDSALNQTYRNVEIFISDNSTDDETERVVAGYDDARIKYFRHKNFDANDNWNFARDYNNPAAEYVNWLMDDDIFLPPKIERMVEIYRTNPDVSLVTSLRRTIDVDGQVTGGIRTPFKNSCKVSGDDAGKFLFSKYENFIGQPTTVLIRKKFLRDNDLCWHDDERGFFNLVDMSTWCRLLTQGNLYHIHEPLSCQRVHDGIASDWVYTPPLMAIQWVKLLKAAWDEKIFLHTQDDLRQAILGWFAFPGSRGLIQPMMNNYRGAEVKTLEKYFVMMAQALSNGGRLELLPIEYSAQDVIKKIR